MSVTNSNAGRAEQRIRRIERLDPRSVWCHEAHNFTPWLQDNIDVLEDAIGLELSAVEREQPAGAFSVDLIAEDGDGSKVVVENQLEKSDHDHLGKLLTYLVGIQATRAVWIVADPRPEHVAAISWLNESSSADFFLLKLEAIRVGNSDVAPLLTQIVGPSEDTSVVVDKRFIVEREELRYRFFKGLLEQAESKTKLHGNISATKHSWVGAGSGIAGVTYNYVVRQHDARVELYIDVRRDGDENQRIFEKLACQKSTIERAVGPLDWDSKEGRRACRISKTCGSGGYRDQGKWKDVYKELVDEMVKLESALKPCLEGL